MAPPRTTPAKSSTSVWENIDTRASKFSSGNGSSVASARDESRSGADAFAC